MKINALLMNIHNNDFKLEKGLQIKKYLPMDVKKTIAQGIIYECTENDGGAIKMDSVQRYLSYVKYMIIMHTDLEYTDEDYDVLCSTEYGGATLLDAIMECFGDDAKECQKILDFMVEDYLRENSVEVVAMKFINSLNTLLSDVATKITTKIDEIDFKDMVPDDVNKKQLSEFLSKYLK